MNIVPVNLAVEDELSEAVLRAILSQLRGYAVGVAYRRGGSGYLRRTIRGFNNAARGTPYVVLADLDRYQCPPALIRDWLSVPQHPNLVFRVAVREVEAWLLAHRSALASFLGIPEKSIPRDVDGLEDPKQTLIDLARRSRFRELRDAIAPRRESTARIGPDYNGRLSAFARKHWDARLAARSSASLQRTLRKLAAFRPTWTTP
jgi:hypothetical protein